jgi:beta-glucosidase
VMAAFNTIGGKPMHANRRLLTRVLKDEWGMAGIIVGDAEGVGNLVPHGVAADLLDAARQSVRAGLDIEMGGSLRATQELTFEVLYMPYWVGVVV